MKREGRTPLFFEDILKHRLFIYGFAALWVMIFHLPYQFARGGIYSLFHHIQSTGSMGVEIFTLLSAAGLYHSLEKHGVMKFYKRRVFRVWLPAAIVLLAVAVIQACSFGTAVGVLSMVGFWFGFPAPWFVGFILTMYLVYPVLHALVKKSIRIVFLITAVAFAVVFLLCAFCYPQIEENIAAFARIPVFLSGVCLIPAFLKNRKIELKALVFPALILFAVVLLRRMLSLPDGVSYFTRTVMYTSFSFLLIPVLASAARFFASKRMFHGFYRIFAFSGSISLELYITFICFVSFAGKLPAYTNTADSLLKLSLVGALSSVVLSVFVKSFSEMLIKTFSETKIPN